MFSTTLFLAVLPLLQVCSGAITCLPIGRTATATWKTDAGQTCTWTGVVGSNFGFNSIGSEWVLLSAIDNTKSDPKQLFVQWPMRSGLLRHGSRKCLV